MKAQWVQKLGESEDAVLTRQRNGVWRYTTSCICGNLSHVAGKAHRHSTTTAMEEQSAINLLIDWGIREEEITAIEGLELYAAADRP